MNVKKAEIEELASDSATKGKQRYGNIGAAMPLESSLVLLGTSKHIARGSDSRGGAAAVFLADELGREIDALATKEIRRVRDAGRVEFEPGAADNQIPLEIHKIGLSDNQLEVIMGTAGPLAEEKRQEFLQRVAAALPLRGQINDDDVSVAVHRALREIMRNSAVWKEWNQNSHPTLQDG